MKRSLLHIGMTGLGALALLAGLALVVLLYGAGQHAFGAVALAVLAIAVYVHVSPRLYAWRYLVPGILSVVLFILVPMVYTVIIGFTNYSSRNLLTFERATNVILGKTIDTGDGMAFKLYRAAGGYRFEFED